MKTETEKAGIELGRVLIRISGARNIPDDIRDLAGDTLKDLVEVFTGDRLAPRRDDRIMHYWLRPRLQSPRGPNTAVRKRRSKAAVARITRNAKKLSELVKKTPAYKSAEFKCIADFDECRSHRGEDSMLCAFAFMICIGRRIVPFMK